MAKQLLATSYEIDLDNNALIIDDVILHERILLITDVSSGIILYNFADPELGATSLSFSEETEKTTLVLAVDLNEVGVHTTSKIQILVDEPESRVNVAEALLDPVNKIRVSNPENLIDTDFEYGLQPTKWETLETSNNIPSFYTGDGDLPITGILQILTTEGSVSVNVYTSEAHGLAVGTPIDIQGVSSRTAEGKFLIASITENTFTYKAKAVQTKTANISGIYTTITPGAFYQGSSIGFDVSTGLQADDSDLTSITITTEADHGFVENNNFYLVNTVGTKASQIKNIDLSVNAADGFPIVDPENVIIRTAQNNPALTETKHIRSRHNLKFTDNEVDVANNTITWTGHGMRTNDCVMYNPPASDTAIGGLSRFNVYYVIVLDENTLRLATTFNGAAITFTDAGTYNYGRAALNLVYELYRLYVPYRSYTTTGYHRNNQTGTGSGWDIQINSPIGGYTRNASFMLPFSKQSSSVYYYVNRNQRFWPNPYTMGTQFGYNNEAGPDPSIYNWVEDFSRFETQAWFTSRSSYLRENAHALEFLNKYRWDGTYNLYPNGQTFYMPFEYEEEGDTLFIADHGMKSGQIVSYTGISTGSPIYVSNSTNTYNNSNQPTQLSVGDYQVQVVSKDRIKISGQRIHSAAGTYDFEYEGAKPTNNTIYVRNHGFINDQELVISTDGGTLPSTLSGPVAPVVNPNTNNALPIAFNALNTKINDYITNTLGSTFLDMTTYGSTSSTNTLVFGTARDNGIINSYNLTTGSHYARYINTNTNVTANLQYYNPAVLNSSTATNIFTGTIYENRNYVMMATDWAPNTTVPYYFTLSSTDFASATEQMYDIFQDNTQFNSVSSPTHYNTRYNETNYTALSGTPYRWSGISWNFYHAAPNERVCYLRFKFQPTNDTTNYYQPTAAMRPVVQSNGNTYQYTYFNSNYHGRRFEGRLIFTVAQSDTNFQNTGWIVPMVQNIIEGFDVGMQYPTISNGDLVKTQVASDDRIRLKKNGVLIDITDNGIGPLTLTTSSQLGVIDGIYGVSGVTDKTISFQTDSKITGQSVQFDASDIFDDTIPLPVGRTHSFISGTAVVYDNGGNADIAELTNGNTYYVIVVDDENIQLSESATDAALGSNPMTLTAGTGNHTFTSTSLAGVVPAQGTVTLSTESNIIIGNNTLFKRYFKVGDIIYIKDNNNSPGAVSKFTVTAIADDSEMSISSVPSFTDTLHFVETKVYARPDGYAVHRPFDGGVEIAAGTAPLSKVTRQTRKYFRYQSGKGIQTSLAINFNPPVTFDTIEADGVTVTATTKYPHRLGMGQSIEINGSSDASYNTQVEVTEVVDATTFKFDLPAVPSTTVPNGIIKFNLRGYSGAYTRAGMFDDQNGFFFEYNGTTLSCCRRSSTTQLSGTVTVTKDGNTVAGTGTNFRGQLNAGDNVVIRGMTYKVVAIDGLTSMSIQPAYRGISSSGIVMTKVETVKVSQENWNVDKCDGNGSSGYNLNIDKIQMAYMDYSWYGAGKLRFGFKDRHGHVIYVHEFLHNNRLDEAYMRSGNLPAKYEIENDYNPTYAPTLFHWGTSVIMDGRFDDDKAYLFTAPSKSLSFTNGDTASINTNANSQLIYNYNRGARSFDWYTRLSFASAEADKFYTGLKLYTATGELNGEEVAYTQYSGSNIYVYIYVTTSRSQPSVYPAVSTGVAVSLGSLASGNGGDVNLGTAIIPLVSLRLSPSVDGNLSGALGARDVINRMQLKLNEVGVILTHDCEVKLILNGDINNVSWENVKNPSLSQLIKHESGDIISGGTEVFSFRASGGSVDNTGKRLPTTSNFPLGDIIDLGNSILGGDGTYPNGPDVLSVAVQVVDTGGIGTANPFGASARVTWSESQA